MVVDEMIAASIDLWISKALRNEAFGAKLVDIGDGEFLMAFCNNNRTKLRRAMMKRACLRIALASTSRGARSSTMFEISMGHLQFIDSYLTDVSNLAQAISHRDIRPQSAAVHNHRAAILRRAGEAIV
jgi:hypothetical protein